MRHKQPESLAGRLIGGDKRLLNSPINGTKRLKMRLTLVENVVYQRALGGDTIAAIYFLKAHRPQYRDRLNVDINQVQSEIEERMAQLTTPDLVARALPALTD